MVWKNTNWKWFKRFHCTGKRIGKIRCVTYRSETATKKNAFNWQQLKLKQTGPFFPTRLWGFRHSSLSSCTSCFYLLSSNRTSCCSGQKRCWQLEEVWCPGTYSPGKGVDSAVKWRVCRERRRAWGKAVYWTCIWSSLGLASPLLPPLHLWPLTTPSYGTFANKNGHGSGNQACSRPLTWKRGSTLQAHLLAPTGIVWPGECVVPSHVISHCS